MYFVEQDSPQKSETKPGIDIVDPLCQGAYSQNAGTEIDDQQKLAFQRSKRRLLIIMAITFAASGLVSGLLSENGRGGGRVIDYLTYFVFAICIIEWCDYDREERRVAPWRAFGLMVLLFPGPLVMFPAYLLVTRRGDGQKGQLFAIAKTAAFFLSLIAVNAVFAEIPGMAGNWRMAMSEEGKAFQQGEEAFEKEDYDLAVSCYTEAIRLDPKYANVYTNRGAAFLRKGDIDKAIADCTEAIRLDPENATAYANRGLAYLNKDDNDKAIADCTKAIQLYPKNARSYYYRGLAFLNKDDNDKAIADFTDTIRLDPKDADAYECRGDAYKAKGDLEKANEDFATAKELGYKP